MSRLAAVFPIAWKRVVFCQKRDAGAFSPAKFRAERRGKIVVGHLNCKAMAAHQLGQILGGAVFRKPQLGHGEDGVADFFKERRKSVGLGLNQIVMWMLHCISFLSRKLGGIMPPEK